MSRAVKVLAVVALLAVAVVVLFTWVFPWVEANLINDPRLGASITAGRDVG